MQLTAKARRRKENAMHSTAATRRGKGNAGFLSASAPLRLTTKTRTIFLCLFLGFFTSLQAQTGQVSGKILDAKTLESLPFANVFINNTTIGVAADMQGNYVLKNIPPGAQEIVYSYVGYSSFQTRMVIQDGDHVKNVIKLAQDEKLLDNVEVTGTRDKKWEKQMVRFRKIFIGADKVAEGCKVLNPWAIEFADDDDLQDGSFVATASQPIEIENFGLGYKVYFYLQSFRANAKFYSILGNYRFEEMQTPDAKLALRWTQNRLETYNGSSRHLFKSIIEGKVKEEGFLLYTDKPGNANSSFRSPTFSNELNKSVIRFSADNIVSAGTRPGEYKISLKGRIEAHYSNANVVKRIYRDIPYPVSWIEVTGGVLAATANGVVINSVDLVTSGAMSTARVANMLPFDYQPGQAARIFKEQVPSLTIDELRWKRWYENAYLHTDKAYYYPGEVIWFKGYMNYLFPEMRDSLSRVLHVELVRPSNKIVQSHLLRIDSGLVLGDIFLSDTLTPGKYYLRAYTQWMRNYEREPLFISEIPILNILDQVEAGESKNISTKNISIGFSKNSYSTREKIQLILKITDDAGQPIAANLSASITDNLQVAPLERDHSIVKEFSLEKEMVSFSGLTMKHFTEYGITVQGKFFNNKKIPQETDITVVQGQFDDFTTVKTDPSGAFMVNGFQFYDTTPLSFQAKDQKGRPFGTIKLQPFEPPALLYNGAGIKLNLKRTEIPQRMLINFQIAKDSKLLEEVVIKGQKLESGRAPIKTYGTADYTLDGARLTEISATTNLLAGLQGKIPGLTVSPYWDENGVQHYKVRIRGGTSTFLGSADPMVLLDGVPFGGDDAGQAIAQISPAMVSKIEVITHANPVFGVRGTNGVLSIWTKSSAAGTNETTSADLSTFSYYTVPGYHRPTVFQSPDYENKAEDATKADYRSTIYWSPYIFVNDEGMAELSFFSADLPGRYRVVVEGVTVKGKPVFGESFIEIKSRD